MDKCYVERQSFATTTDRAAHLTRHLQVRQGLGKAVVIADQPIVFLSGLRKHWLKMILAVKRERSRTLDSDLIGELNRQVKTMEDLSFSARPPHLSLNADVQVIAPNQLNMAFTDCHAVYLCAKTGQQEFKDYINKLPENCVLVDYIS